MDYVREELLRQQAVLELLMAGGSREEAASEAEEEVLREGEFISGAAESVRRLRTVEEAREQISFRRNRGVRAASTRRESRLVEEPFSLTEGIREVALRPEAVRSSVREVSRAIQRDARRYDGGFTIY